VVAGRLHCDLELAGDLPVREAPGKKPQDLDLALGEARWRLGPNRGPLAGCWGGAVFQDRA